jgi:hypothetical protein
MLADVVAMKSRLTASAIGALLALTDTSASCADTVIGADEGKLLLTAGFSDLEGSGGGGLVPLAFITGYGSNESWGVNAHFTSIQLRDFHLHSFGMAIGLFDRLELSSSPVTGTYA